MSAPKSLPPSDIQNVTIWINPPCDVHLNREEIAQIGVSLEKNGLTIDEEWESHGNPYMPADNTVLFLDKGINKEDIPTVFSNIKEALKDIDTEFTETGKSPPAPKCGIPMTSIEQDDGGRSA